MQFHLALCCNFISAFQSAITLISIFLGVHAQIFCKLCQDKVKFQVCLNS